MAEAPEQHIIHSVSPFEWSPDDAIRYEIAGEKMSRVGGIYSNLARRPDAPAADVARYRAEMARWAETRRHLRAADPAAVEAVSRTCTALIAQLGVLV